MAASLARTCSARVACWYLVPLAMTAKAAAGPAVVAAAGAAAPADGTDAAPAALDAAALDAPSTPIPPAGGAG